MAKGKPMAGWMRVLKWLAIALAVLVLGVAAVWLASQGRRGWLVGAVVLGLAVGVKQPLALAGLVIAATSRARTRRPWPQLLVRAVVIAVVAIGWYLFHNTQHNLAQRGILSGFGFLEQSAGFGISQHLIDYTESDSYGRVFVIGLLA